MKYKVLLQAITQINLKPFAEGKRDRDSRLQDSIHEKYPEQSKPPEEDEWWPRLGEAPLKPS